MAAITTEFGTGGANLTPNDSAGTPTLATALRDVADDLAGVGTVPAWTTAIAVAAHTVTLPTAGWILAVDGDTGGTAGGKKIVNAAALTLEVQVVYDAAGIPTLNFFAADAITQCAVQQIPWAALETTKA